MLFFLSINSPGQLKRRQHLRVGWGNLGVVCCENVWMLTGSSGFPLPVQPTLEQLDGSSPKDCWLGNKEIGSVCPMWEGVRGLPGRWKVENEAKKSDSRHRKKKQFTCKTLTFVSAIGVLLHQSHFYENKRWSMPIVFLVWKCWPLLAT